MLFGWMKTLVVYLILSGIVMNLSPDSNYKKYINFLMGLIVILIISEPLTYFFNISGGDIENIAESMDEYMKFPELYDRDMTDYYDVSLRDGIAFLLEENNITAREIVLICDQERKVSSCQIYIRKEELLNDGEIKNIICDVYKIDFNSIYIVRR